MDCCVQGQGHSEGSKCQWKIVWLVSSEPPNIVLPNLVGWCIIMILRQHYDLECPTQKKIVHYLQVQGHIEGLYYEILLLFLPYSPLAPTGLGTTNYSTLSSRSRSQWGLIYHNKIWLFLLTTISFELLILLQPDLVLWNFIISPSILPCKATNLV